MRTTVDIPESLLRRARARAALEGLKMMDVVNEALTQYLGANAEADTANLPRRVKPERMGRFTIPVVQSAGPGRAKVTVAQLKDRQSENDEERHAKVFGR